MAHCQVEARFLGSIHVRVNGVSRLTNDTCGHHKRDLFENSSFWKRILVHVHVLLSLPSENHVLSLWKWKRVMHMGVLGGGGGSGGSFYFLIYIFIFLWQLQLQLLPFATQQIKTRKRLETEARSEETLRRASWQYVRRCEEKTAGLTTTIRGRKRNATRL